MQKHASFLSPSPPAICIMRTTVVLAILLYLFLAQLGVSANSNVALFDKSPDGQSEWSRFCSASASPSSETLPFACFTIHDDICSAAHSSFHAHLGFASSSGQGELSWYASCRPLIRGLNCVD